MTLSRRVPSLILSVLIAASSVVAQSTTPPLTPPPVAGTDAAAPAPTITRQEIQDALDRLGAATEPDDGTQAQAVKILEDALVEIERSAATAGRAASLRSQEAEAPQLLEAIRAELETAYVPPEITRPADATIQMLEQQLAQATTTLAAERARAAELQRELERRSARRDEVPDEIVMARAELKKLEAAIAAKSEGAGAALDEARAALLRAQWTATQATIDMLEAELASYEARRDLLPARRDQATRRVTEAGDRVKAWQTLTSRERARDAEASVERAEKQKKDAELRHEVLERFAAESERLTKLRTGGEGLSARIEKSAVESLAARDRLDELLLAFQSIRRRIEVSGLNRATGLLLRRQYDALPVASKLRSQLRTTLRDLEDADYALIEYEEARLGAGDIDRVAQALLDEIRAGDAIAAESGLAAAARGLAVARRDILARLVADADTYRDRLVELDHSRRDLLAATEAFESLIEERILWVPSFAMDRLVRTEDLRAASSWLLRPGSWARVWQGSTDYLRMHWALGLAGVAILLTAFGLSLWARVRSKQIAALVAKHRTNSFHQSVEVLVWAFVGAIPIPLFLWCIAVVLDQVPDQPDVGLALASGLRPAAIFHFSFSFVRHVFGAKGLGGAHFRWPESVNGPIRRNFQWFINTMVPLIVLVVGLDKNGDDAANASVGRIAASIGLLAIAVFFYRMFRPSGPAMSEYLKRQASGGLARLRMIGFPGVVALPLVLLVATWAGYYYAAQQIVHSLLATFLLVGVLVTLSGMLQRWLYLARRHVALEDAKRRREEIQTAVGGAKDLPSEATAPIDVEKLDLPSISGQTRQLFRTAIFLTAIIGLFGIWAQTLPALQMLDRMQVWPTFAMLESPADERVRGLELRAQVLTSSTAEVGGAPAAGAERPVATRTPGTIRTSTDTVSTADVAGAPDQDVLSVTVADIGLALIVIIATWVAFRNVPGLVEITVLKRLPLDAGSRYALSTVLRYAIAIVGVCLACSAVGVSWSRVQWLAAALTFGLAFGLQEIFANFVSGLIILAERPFRIGDTVTVGTVSGTVSRIRMRATTVVDWDRKELVIPNKTFITGEVINWTLSNPVLRVRIPIGVAYGSDVNRVETLLLEIAQAQDSVLDDPKPQALFIGFGESALDFELRVFIAHVDHLLSVRHVVLKAIDMAFREASIEISFPQRDLHIRSIGDFDQLVQRKTDLAGETAGWGEPN